jgi:hypothetical protein
MEQVFSDLLSILNIYTSKQNSATVKADALIQFITTAIGQKNTKLPGINSFLEDTENKIYKALDALIENKQVTITDGNVETIYFPGFYQKQISNAYEYIDTSIETPFPGDTSLSLQSLQNIHMKTINILNDFTGYLLDRDENDTMEVVRIVFSGNYGNAVVLAQMLPKGILQVAMIKLRDYLYRYGNNDFFQEKLKHYFVGKERIVMDYFKNITTSPEKSISLILSGNDFSASFWSYFYSLVNAELQHQQVLKGNRSVRDIALYQASTIILACNNYYQTLALNERDRSLILSVIEKEMDKPPYYYTLEEIGRFKSAQGQEVSHDYSVQDLKEYFKQNIKPGDGNAMPPVLIFHGPQKEIWYVKKSKVVNLCEDLINEASRVLRKCIEDRWYEIIKNYQTENTMRDALAFESLISDFALVHAPHLIPIIWDPKMEFILDDLKSEGVPIQFELFHTGELITLRRLLDLKQDAILASIYSRLPFWYASKFIMRIMRFIKHGIKGELVFNKKIKRNKTPEAKPKSNEKILDKVDLLAKNLITAKNSIESELEALAGQWNQQIGKEAQKKLRQDVDSIINIKISFELKTLKFGNLSISIIEDLAESLATSDEVLKRINNRKALRKYIMLYMLKLIKMKTSQRTR